MVKKREGRHEGTARAGAFFFVDHRIHGKLPLLFCVCLRDAGARSAVVFRTDAPPFRCGGTARGVRHGMRRGRRPVFFKKRPESVSSSPAVLAAYIACVRNLPAGWRGPSQWPPPAPGCLSSNILDRGEQNAAGSLVQRILHGAGHACLAVEHGDGRRVQAVGIRRFGQGRISAP